MSPVLELVDSQIIEQLETFGTRSSTNRFALKPLKHKAKQMASSDPSQSYTSLGAISCIEHDISGMHSNHLNAIALCRNDFTLLNYAVSLTKSGLWDEAADYYEQAYESEPLNLVNLDILIHSFARIGLYGRSLEYICVWEKQTLKIHPLREQTTLIIEFLKRNSISESDISTVLRTVGNIVSDTELRIDTDGVFFVDGDNAFINHDFIYRPSSSIDICSIENDVDNAIESLQVPSIVLDSLAITFCSEEVGAFIHSIEADIEHSSHSLVSPTVDQLEEIRLLVEEAEA